MMKKILFILILSLLSLTAFAQFNPRDLYKDYGTWNVQMCCGNKIATHAYVTKSLIVIDNSKSLITQTYKYRYQLYLVSESLHNNNLTNTWLYGAKVYINNVEVTKEQFPNGFNIYVLTEPTLVYWYETNFENLDFLIKWVNSSFDATK